MLGWFTGSVGQTETKCPRLVRLVVQDAIAVSDTEHEASPHAANMVRVTAVTEPAGAVNGATFQMNGGNAVGGHPECRDVPRLAGTSVRVTAQLGTGTQLHV